MAKPKSSEQPYRQMAPAMSPEAQERRCIAMAMDLAEERLRNRTASSQEVTHFLKRGSEKELLELEKLRGENKLLEAKTESLKSQKRVEELYEDAIKSMRNYAGQGEADEY